MHTSEHGYEEMLGAGAREPRVDDRHRRSCRSSRTTCTRSPDDDLFLIPTAEVPVTNLYRDEILDARDAADGVRARTRRASGARPGRRARTRAASCALHQFDKVELVRYATPEDVGRGARAADADTPRRCSSGSGFRIA